MKQRQEKGGGLKAPVKAGANKEIFFLYTRTSPEKRLDFQSHSR
jgi:hypothetical protein